MSGILPNDIDAAKRAWSAQPSSGALDPREPIALAIEEHCRRVRFDAQRVSLAQALNDVLYDDIVFETDRAYGSETTRAAYKTDFNKFREWCGEQGLPWLPTSPEVVAHFLIEQAAATRPDRLQRITSAIKYAHEWADKPYRGDDLLIKAALRWARRCWEQEQAKETETATELPNAAPSGVAQH